MRYVWSAFGAAGRLLTAFAWIALAALVLAIAHKAEAQVQPPTRTTAYDWQCQDANGQKISDHQRIELAYVACLNDSRGAFVQGGRYRVNRPCPAKPADETQTLACPAGSTGSWTQTRVYASAPAPTCWAAGEWTPATPPAGACVTAPTADTTPPSVPSNPQAQAISSSEIRLTWSAAADNIGVTGYWIGRCVGAGCTSFAPLPVQTGLSYSDTGLSTGTTVRYRVRAIDAAGNNGLFGPIVEATTPARAGTALLSWTPPTTYTDGSALTDLSGYRILYSLGSTTLDRSIDVPNPAVSSYAVEGLSPGTWYFAALALTSSARISAKSNIVTKVVQ